MCSRAGTELVVGGKDRVQGVGIARSDLRPSKSFLEDSHQRGISSLLCDIFVSQRSSFAEDLRLFYAS